MKHRPPWRFRRIVTDLERRLDQLEEAVRQLEMAELRRRTR